jgi:F0F1-type ATP synthase alpha subunit
MSQKITDEQLKDLQEKVGVIQQLQTQIGNIEGQKHILLHQLVSSQENLQELQKSLEEEYGKVSINIQDGTYEAIPEEQEVVGPEVLSGE